MSAFVEFMNIDVGGEKLWQVIAFFVVVLASSVAGRLLKFFFDRAGQRLADSKRELTALALNKLSKPAVLLTVTAGVWFGLAILALDGRIGRAAETACYVLVVGTIGYAAHRMVDVLDVYLRKVAERTESKVDDMLVPLVGKSLRITVIVLASLQIVQALSDKPLTSILAGLGVGGLAIALAGQDTVKNFFGSLVILADKPFEIGDRIVVDGHDGPVEDVGFRSTKLRRLDGHLVTVPNSEMVNKTVENIGKRPYIKRAANITVTYDTSPEKVAKAVEILKEILKDHDGMNPEFPPRVHFSDFSDWALCIQMIYWFHPPDYWQYMEFSEKVNFEILRRFNDEGIEFAFPSQTVYHANDDNRQLSVKMLTDQQ